MVASFTKLILLAPSLKLASVFVLNKAHRYDPDLLQLQMKCNTGLPVRPRKQGRRDQEEGRYVAQTKPVFKRHVSFSCTCMHC